MKKTLLLGAAALFAVAASAKPASNDTTVVICLDPETPMHCMNCENTIRGELRFCRGVKEIKTSLDDQTVTVRYDRRKGSAADLRATLSRLGYEAAAPADTIPAK